MRYPFLISSDQHCHGWSQFSTTLPNGVNSRLQIILDEVERSYATLGAEGGNTAFLAGDLYHVRGNIQPSVFNPTMEMFKWLHDGSLKDSIDDLMTYALPGNHDLEGRDATKLGNAMQALDAIDGFNVLTEPTRMGDVWVFPWCQDLNELRAKLKKHANPKYDAIIHAPVNGVIKGIPDHGLEAAELAAMGYRRVFSGHYHDHRVFEGGKVISIGATSHQTWSDVGSLAGFLLVYEDRIEHHPSFAPSFVDLGMEDLEELGKPDACALIENNYVRLKLTDVTEEEIKAWRADLTKAGALGVNIMATKKSPTGERSGAGAKSGLSLAASVHHFIEYDLTSLVKEEVSKLAAEVLTEAQS